MKKAGGLVACALVLLSASAFLLYHLGNEPLQDYDEATYAEVVHEAFVSHHFLSYTEGGVPFFEKPPLAFWGMEVSESLFGENTFAMRLPFVVAGIATLVVLMLLLYEVTASWWAAAVGGAVLATTSPFMETARQVRLDTPVVFFIVLAAYFFVRGMRDSRWLLAFGAAVGLAVMSKSVIAAFAVVAAILVLILYRRFDLFKNKYAYGSMLAALLVAAPWHLWEWAHFGSAFWSRYIGFDVINRAQENLFWTVTLTNADYVNYLFAFTQPWIWVFFAAVACVAVGWKRFPEQSRRFSAVSIATIAAVIAVFFTAKTKAPTYLLPIYPFAAITIALAFANARTLFWQTAAGVVFVLLLLSGAYSTYYNAYHFNPYYSVVIPMAQDEKAIGATLFTVPQSVPVYVFDDQNLGSIFYYSRRPLLILLTATSTAPAAGYVIVDTNGLPLFAQTFSTTSTTVVYSGPQVSLLQIHQDK